MGPKFPQVLRQQHGFSLAELMIVVAIIGLLSSMAIPQFQRFAAKAKQSEAKTNLSQIRALQEAYYGDNDQYYDGTGHWGASIPAIGFVTQNPRYSYGTAATQGYFTAGAGANNANSIRPGCTWETWWTDTYGKIWSIGDCSVDP